MNAPGRRVTTLVFAGAAAVLLVGGVIAKRPLQRRWFTWRFESGDDQAKQEVARHLVALDALEIVEGWYRQRFERGDASVKVAVAAGLASIQAGTVAEDLFLEELLSGNRERLDTAADWFGDHGDATTARKLLSRLRVVTESSAIAPHDREDAVMALYNATATIAGREKASVVPVLIEFIAAPASRPGDAYQARVCATYLLAGLGTAGQEAIPTLQRYLNDHDEAFRAAVERALAQIRP